MARQLDEALEAMSNDDAEIIAHGIMLAESIIDHSRHSCNQFDSALDQGRREDLTRLKAVLVALVHSGKSDKVVGAATFALGKLHDPGLTGFFIEVLRRYLRGDPNVLYQAMIALDNLDLNVFDGRNNMTVLDMDMNRTLATSFLRQLESNGEVD